MIRTHVRVLVDSEACSYDDWIKMKRVADSIQHVERKKLPPDQRRHVTVFAYGSPRAFKCVLGRRIKQKRFYKVVPCSLEDFESDAPHIRADSIMWTVST